MDRYTKKRLEIDKANEFELEQIIYQLKELLKVSSCNITSSLLDYALNKRNAK